MEPIREEKERISNLAFGFFNLFVCAAISWHEFGFGVAVMVWSGILALALLANPKAMIFK